MACCKGSTQECVCATEARCSCKSQPAGKCNCTHAAVENAQFKSTCDCGKRPKDGCNCQTHNATREGEIDFTNLH